MQSQFFCKWFLEVAAYCRAWFCPLSIMSFEPFCSIGYPVVTLGFGFKTYVSYRMRRRRQKEVQKVNEYYYEFLREALPPGPVREEAFNPHPTSPCKSLTLVSVVIHTAFFNVT